MKRLLKRFLILACCSVAVFAPSYFYGEYKSKQIMEVVIEQNKLVMENRTRTEILRAGINYVINGLDQLSNEIKKYHKPELTTINKEFIAGK